MSVCLKASAVFILVRVAMSSSLKEMSMYGRETDKTLILHREQIFSLGRCFPIILLKIFSGNTYWKYCSQWMVTPLSFTFSCSLRAWKAVGTKSELYLYFSVTCSIMIGGCKKLKIPLFR